MRYKKKNISNIKARHVFITELDARYDTILYLISISRKLRRASNVLTGIMQKKLKALLRDKTYRETLELYRKEEDEKQKKEIGKELFKIGEKHNVSWEFCRKKMIEIQKRLGIKSIFALTKAEDIWCGVEKCLFSNGKELHFFKYGDLSSIRAKQTTRGIVLYTENDVLAIEVDKKKLDLILKDRFQADEHDAIVKYLNNKSDDFRPCFCTIVPKLIRGKYRLYLHITVEGKACSKYDKEGNIKHHYGKGVVGIDIGTQSIAYTSETEVNLKNLSERGSNITKNEKRERRLLRAMDRSKRATNPNNYKKDGTIKKGPKKWIFSKRYKKLREKFRDLCRKGAINRKLAINEDVNYIRSLGDVLITEPKNASKLMKRAKKTTKNDKGKFKKKKRFGKSIKNRCPGKFQSSLEQKFKVSNGTYIEVPKEYRASQYDHTVDDYIKKKLSQRIYKLKDGTTVQRDWYSSFLLYCYNMKTETIDKIRCKQEFDRQLEKEQRLIEQIKDKKVKIFNSGIKI